MLFNCHTVVLNSFNSILRDPIPQKSIFHQEKGSFGGRGADLKREEDSISLAVSVGAKGVSVPISPIILKDPIRDDDMLIFPLYSVLHHFHYLLNGKSHEHKEEMWFSFNKFHSTLTLDISWRR